MGRHGVRTLVAGGFFLAGCTQDRDANPQIVPPGQQVSSDNSQVKPATIVAEVNGEPISREALVKPLIEAYGLNLLLQLVQLNLAHQHLNAQHLVFSTQDVEDERAQTLKKAFPDATTAEYPQLLDQLLSQQNLTMAQFNFAMETNACLRKLATPQIAGKASEENLLEAFGIRYGEQVKVRDIALPNLQKVAEAKGRLAAGDSFAKVAFEMSTNDQTRMMGGELPEFARANPNFPEIFKEAAFALKIGEVSDPVNSEGVYHLIKLEGRIPPKIVKFEQVKEVLREELESNAIQQKMREVRNELAREAISGRGMEIKDPVLRDQLQQRLDQVKKESDAQEVARKASLKQQLPKLGTPVTRPATEQTPTELTTEPPIKTGGSGLGHDLPAASGDGASTKPARNLRPPATMGATAS